MSAPESILILGVGYCGGRVANALANQGWQVFGTAREPVEGLHGSVTMLYPDHASHAVDQALLHDALQRCTHILATAPVDRSTGMDPFLQEYGQLLSVAAVQGRVHWCGYLSTTSVYGDHGGGWVDETTPLGPTLKRGVLRKNAEAAWMSTGLPVHIFRLPGIYGPGRGVVAKMKAGKTEWLFKEDHYFSRIHVDDIVNVVLASIRNPNPGRAYNVVDSEPCNNRLVTDFCHQELGLPKPTYIDMEAAKATMSKMALSFYQDNKRCSNRRVLEELNVKLLYPSFREGMRAQIAQEQDMEAARARASVLQLVYKPLSVFGGIARCLFRFGVWGFSYIRFGVLHLFPHLYRRSFRFVTGSNQYSPVTPRAGSLKCLLVDNGSVRPQPTLTLRKLSGMLESRFAADKGGALSGRSVSVFPVSAAHSNRANVEALGGTKAVVVSDFVEQELASQGAGGDARPRPLYVLLPLFIGPSKTILTTVPNKLNSLVEKLGGELVTAPPLFDDVNYFGRSPSERGSLQSLAKILAVSVERTMAKRHSSNVRVLLVDHGSPSRQVNRARRGLAAQLRQLLVATGSVEAVLDCSMEKRDGPAYAFNDPLLEDAFDVPGWDQGSIVVAHAFLSPGRHAGPNGDIVEIIQRVKAKKPEVEILCTPLICDDGHVETLLDLLATRFRESIQER